jgi:hypothetical protein
MFWERLGGLDEFKELLLPIQNPATLAGQDLTLGLILPSRFGETASTTLEKATF